jgi:hypothetical protein
LAKLKTLWWLVAVLLLLVCGIGVYAAWLIRSGLPGHADFYLNRGKYESIVARAKSVSLAPGAQTQTHLDGLVVDIGRSQSGSYTITITTVDWHHAGMYGYVFSDAQLTPHANVNYPDYQSVDNPGDMPFVDKAIMGQGGRWWAVYNNLL